MLTATLEDTEYEQGELEAMMVQALIWSVGAVLIESARVRFDAYLKYLAGLIVIYDEQKSAGLGTKYCYVYFYVLYVSFFFFL